jgi:hypothetical protein
MHHMRCPTVEDVIAGSFIEVTRVIKLGRLTLCINFIRDYYYYVTACGYCDFSVRVQSCLCRPPGKTRYPLYRRLGGPQGRSGRVIKISPPPGFFFVP